MFKPETYRQQVVKTCSHTIIYTVCNLLSLITCTAPYDYTPIDQTLVFTPQMGRRYIDIEVADDIFREPNEFFGVILSSNDPVVNVQTTLAVVEIMDTSGKR